MKILLIYPPCLEERIHTEDVKVVPQGVYFIAAVLRENGYDVEILNGYDIKKTPHRIQEILSENKPAVIGFSILHANRWGGIEIARLAKKLDPDVKIVFGGIGATYLWEHFLAHFPEIDFIVTGEGERSFIKLVEHLKEGGPDHVAAIRGIAYRQNGRPVKTANEKAIHNLDALPNPARYFTYQHVSLTRGCAYNCSFCGSPRFWKNRVRFHSADYFVEELALLYRRGVRFFYFSDDTFTVNADKTIDVCKKIVERGLDINWAGISRVDHAKDEVLYWMRKAGCIQISYGVESGSEKIRNTLNKRIALEQIRHAFATTVKYGILARAYFIYGCPGESWDTIHETMELIQDINPLGAIFYILDLFPGTELFERFKAQTRCTDDVWLNRIEDIMYFETDSAMDSDLIKRFGKKLRTRFHENLPRAVEAIDLIDQKDLYPLHADFLSRLAMTFDQGDYARIDAIKNKSAIAEELYQKALGYHHDARAYLGLGMIRQKTGRVEKSMHILDLGLRQYPGNEPLNICQGINYMNMGRFKRALDFFLPFRNSPQTRPLIADCYRALKRFDEAAKYAGT